jgi:hypothetical protein
MVSADYGTLPHQPPIPGGAAAPPADSVFSTEHSILRSGSKRSLMSRSRVNVWELMFLPWALLALVLVTYFIAGIHGEGWVLLFVAIVLLTLIGFFIRWHYKAANNADCVLGILCLTAVVIALIVGVWAEVNALQEYGRLDRGGSYFNVLPSELAYGKDDATTLVFTNQTQVDLSRTYGYIYATSSSSHTYCVAPVGMSSSGTEKRVQYFAVGKDCCGFDTDFRCISANDNAHAGIVLPQTVRNSAGYLAAIRGAEAFYGFKAADGYLLVNWMQNPVGYRDKLWNQAFYLFLIFGGVYLVISVMMGIALMPVVAGPGS